MQSIKYRSTKYPTGHRTFYFGFPWVFQKPERPPTHKVSARGELELDQEGGGAVKRRMRNVQKRTVEAVKQALAAHKTSDGPTITAPASTTEEAGTLASETTASPIMNFTNMIHVIEVSKSTFKVDFDMTLFLPRDLDPETEKALELKVLEILRDAALFESVGFSPMTDFDCSAYGFQLLAGLSNREVKFFEQELQLSRSLQSGN